MLPVEQPFKTYTGLDGMPLDDGYVWFGLPNQNPQTAPITVYWDSDSTIPALQPLRTVNGYIIRAGTPANVFYGGDYSEAVFDSKGQPVFYAPDSSDFSVVSAINSFLTGVEKVTVADYATPAAAIAARSGKRLYVQQGDSLTLNVPSVFSSIQAAMTAIAGWYILGHVTIKVADGTYQATSSVNLNHPFGANISIVGNVTTPDNVVVKGSSPPTFDLFVVSGGQQFGLIQGMRADISAKALQANNFTAFLALNGASLSLDHINSNNWYYGVAARNGGVIKYTTGTVNNAGDVGVWAFAGGNIQCSGVASNNASDTANNLGFGFQAEFGGVVEAQNCTATGCRVAGLAALSNGTGRYYNCTANANLGSGIMSRGGGQIEANGSSSTGNTRYGIEITEYGNIVNLATNTGNTLGAANAFPFFDVSTGQARLAASVGQLRLDTNDTSSTYFNTVNGLQAEVRDMPSAVNHPVLQGGATGKPVNILADGSDTVIDLALFPKGAGSYVQFGAGYFTPAPAASGYFSMKLADGSVVKVPCLK